MNSDSGQLLDPNPTRRSYGRIVFGMDLRSLAGLRILFGCCLLIDLWMRWGHLQAMYSDAGIVPLGMLNEYLRFHARWFNWSFHALSGGTGWQVFLFGVAAVVYTMFLVGYRTRLASIAAWILLVSVQLRNPLILHSGDTLMRIGLFWMIFLPLGAVWSLDSRRRQATGVDTVPDREFASPATAGLMLLMFSLYFFAGLAKMNEIWWQGLAMEYVSRLDIYQTSIGQWVRQFPLVLKWITWSTLVIEVVLPFLLFSPWWNRRLRVLLIFIFAGFHLGIALTMNIGLFQYVAIGMWLALVPGAFWDWLGKWMAGFRFPLQIAPAGPPLPWSGRVAWGVSLFFAIYFLLWNIASIERASLLKYAMPRPLELVGRSLNLRQEFRMFDVPPTISPWFVYEARLADGTVVDIMRNAPVSHERPEAVLDTIPGHHWRRLHRNLVRENVGMDPFRQQTADFLKERWNRTHPEHQQIVSYKVTVYMDEIVPFEEIPSGQIVVVWKQVGTEQDTFNELLQRMKQKGEILP